MRTQSNDNNLIEKSKKRYSEHMNMKKKLSSSFIDKINKLNESIQLDTSDENKTQNKNQGTYKRKRVDKMYSKEI